MSKRYNATGRLRTQQDDVLNTRTNCVLKFQAVAPATADTLLTLTKNLGGTETTGTSFTATSGKRLRFTHLIVSLTAKAAAAAFGVVNIRGLASGATLIGSPSLLEVPLGLTAATAEDAKQVVVPLPEGFEIGGTQSIGVSASSQATTNKWDIQLCGYEYTPAT